MYIPKSVIFIILYSALILYGIYLSKKEGEVLPKLKDVAMGLVGIICLIGLFYAVMAFFAKDYLIALIFALPIILYGVINEYLDSKKT